MKHTEGPWIVNLTDTNGHGGWSIEVGIHNIASVYANIVRAPRKDGDMARLKENQESIANAHLIASAPELLEACKYAIEQLKNVKGRTFPVLPILNAIAKAEGRE